MTKIHDFALRETEISARFPLFLIKKQKPPQGRLLLQYFFTAMILKIKMKMGIIRIQETIPQKEIAEIALLVAV